MMTLRYICLVFAVLVGCAAAAKPDPKVDVRRSIVALQNESGDIFCTGFVIDRQRRHVMTADHCLKQQEQPIMNQKRGWEIYHIPDLDVAILKADAVWNVPALKPRMTILDGDGKIAAYGYAWGKDVIRRIDGKITLPVFFFTPDGPPFTLYTPNVIQGMSGGPVVDEDGLVVGINQMTRTNPNMSITRPMLFIYSLSKDYWEFQPEKIEQK